MSENYVLVGYVLFAISAASLLPIAFSIHQITDIYFVDHITKKGKHVAIGLYFYAGSILLDMAVLGWPFVSGIIGFTLIFGRIYGFTQMNKLFTKIKSIFGLKIGSVFLILFAYFSVIVSIISGVADFAQDVSFNYFLLLFNGIVESALMVIIGVKIIIDFKRIQKFILQEEIKPYTAKTAFLVQKRSESPVLPTTKEHIQSKLQIERLREKTAKQVKPYKITEQFLKVEPTLKHPTKIEHKEELETIEVEKYEQRRRILTASKELILQISVMMLAVTTFIAYSFIISNPLLIGISWVIIAVFGTYLLVNTVVHYFLGRGYAVTAIFSDLLYLFVFLPSFVLVISFLLVLVLRLFIPMSDEMLRILSFTTSALLEIVAIVLVINRKLESLDMNIREYFHYFFDTEARAREILKEQERIARKRSSFDKLDSIANTIDKRLEEKEIQYEDFDFKKRLKDLGSPLENDED